MLESASQARRAQAVLFCPSQAQVLGVGESPLEARPEDEAEVSALTTPTCHVLSSTYQELPSHSASAGHGSPTGGVGAFIFSCHNKDYPLQLVTYHLRL